MSVWWRETSNGSFTPSKNVSARPVVKSMKSEISTMRPGVMSDRIPPLTAVASTECTPQSRKAQMLAR